MTSAAKQYISRAHKPPINYELTTCWFLSDSTNPDYSSILHY
jgi:hypothetical protein